MIASVATVVVCAVTAFYMAESRSAESCRIQLQPVVIDLEAKHEPVLAHARAAIRDSHEMFLTLARTKADANRRASIGNRTDEDPSTDADEYPPASSDEGGEGASVRFIDSSANRSAGAIMGAQLRAHCDGQVFRFERTAGER